VEKRKREKELEMKMEIGTKSSNQSPYPHLFLKQFIVFPIELSFEVVHLVVKFRDCGQIVTTDRVHDFRESTRRLRG